MSVTADDGFSVSVGIWDVAEYVTGVLWLIAVSCESVLILEKVLCIEPSFNSAVGLAAGVDACTFDEAWVLAESVKGTGVV